LCDGSEVEDRGRGRDGGGVEIMIVKKIKIFR
jgi:hypothetical protein